MFMAGDARERARELVRSAIGLDAASRSALFEGIAHDPEISAEVRALLADVSGTVPEPDGASSPDAASAEYTATHLDVSRLVTQSEPPPGPRRAARAPLERVGAYRIVRALGAGGMGEVFEAYDERLRRRVAIKSVRAGFGEAAKVRFLREARALSSLNHPNICAIHDFVEARGESLLVLEFIDGRPLSRLVGTLSRRRALEIGEQVARVLAAAHAAGIVHRDLKPDNVMVTEDGTVKVLDFGLARSVAPGADDGPLTDGTTVQPGVASPDASVTSPGTILGTPMYMSPEQAEGHEATPASDVFALGLLLQELATGRSHIPRGLPIDAVLKRARHPETDPPGGLGPGLGALVRQLKSLSPGDRPAAADAARRLASIRAAPRRRAVYAAAATVVILAAAGGVKYAVDLERERSKEEITRKAADAAREDAEGFVSLLVDKSRDQLQAAGRLDVLDSIAGEVRAYYARRPPGSLDREQILKFAKAVQISGEAALGSGRLDKAGEAFARGRDLAADLVAREPNDGRFLRALGAAHFYLGLIARRSGDLTAAEREWTAYLDAAQRLVALDADNPEWQLELAYAHSNFVPLNEDRGNFSAARDALQKSLDIKRRLADADPASAEYRRGLANSLTQLANAEDRAGNSDAALTAADEAVRALAAEDPRDAEGRYRLTVCHGHAGELRLKYGRHAEALTSFRTMQDVARALVTLDPSNGEWLRQMAVGHRLAAQALVAAGVGAGARIEIAACRRAFEDLVARDPKNVRWRRDLVRAEFEAANVASVERQWDEAIGCLRRARAALEGSPADTPEARDDLAVRLASVELQEGKVRAASGSLGEARSLWSSAVTRLEPVASAKGEYDVLNMLAQALLLLGRPADAAPHLRRLHALGWSPSGEVASLLEQVTDK